MTEVIDDGTISHLEIGERALNALRRANINHVVAIHQMTDGELLRIEGLGRLTLAEIRRAVASYMDRNWRTVDEATRRGAAVKKKADGGPAFPMTVQAAGGLTLRDAFALAALQGMLAANAHQEDYAGEVAKWAYEYADDMLAEREKP